ncbi:hypothetical protein SNE40_021144 [Patella caerulea]|uniref:Uncharacterized protein n=1 Tax=Patella caerulea TaxID=87958 RepID=A0AAN8GGJ6_PATCE
MSEYIEYNNRLATFDNRWTHVHPSAHKLSESGFVFFGNNDRVQCFSCKLILKDWQPFDDPFHEHTKYQPNCPYMRMIKGSLCGGYRWEYKGILAGKVIPLAHSRVLYKCKAECIDAAKKADFSFIDSMGRAYLFLTEWNRKEDKVKQWDIDNMSAVTHEFEAYLLN